MNSYTTKSFGNCGPCSFINLTDLPHKKSIELDLARSAKLKPYKASSYSSFLVWASLYNKNVEVYTSSKKLNKKIFDLMNHYEKIQKHLHEKYKKQTIALLNSRNKKYKNKIKNLTNPIKKLDSLLEQGKKVAVLTSDFYLSKKGNPVPHWIVAYKKEKGKYYFMDSANHKTGITTLTKTQIKKGLEINKNLGYSPALIAESMQETKLLIIGDLHGRKPKIKFKDFDAIVVIGDVASDKDLSPYTKKWFRYLKKNPAISLEEFFILKLGKKKLKQFEKKSLVEGNKILKYLDKFNKPIFMVAGNWDQSYGPTKIKDYDKNDYSYYKSFLDWWAGDKINPKLIKGVKNIKNCMFHLHKFDGINILGYGLNSVYEKPSMRKRRKYTAKQLDKLNNAYNHLLKKLDKTYQKRNKNFPTIFLTHNVPYNTKLDIVKDKKSVAYKKHIGSMVGRNFCTKYQPLLCVGGHIHDHYGKDKIKKTVVINAGFGKNAQTLVEIKNKKIKKITFSKLKG